MLMGCYAGEKVAHLAQLRLQLATSSNYISPDKRILLLLLLHLMHSHVLLVEERMSDVASTTPWRN
jgi:hypothetical protein